MNGFVESAVTVLLSGAVNGLFLLAVVVAVVGSWLVSLLEATDPEPGRDGVPSP